VGEKAWPNTQAGIASWTKGFYSKFTRSQTIRLLRSDMDGKRDVGAGLVEAIHNVGKVQSAET